MAVQQLVLFAAGPAPVDLGDAHPFAVLAGSAITSTGGITITGDVGLSPGGGTSITGLTSPQVTGTIYTVDAAGPAGSVQNATLLTLAQDALTAAYNDAQGRVPVPTGAFLDPNGGDIGGQNLVPGLYKFTTGASITGSDLTLTGGPDDVWIFQIGSTLVVGSNIGVVLAGGAQARNVFWQVGSSATIGTNATFRGTIMVQDSITLSTGSVMDGRALASTSQVTLDGLSGDLPNEVPVAVADAATVLEGGTVTVLTTGPGNTSVLDNDTDQNAGDTLTAVLVDNVANGTLTLNADGTFSYTHDGSETSADSFTYRVYDGTEYSNTVTVSITIDPAGSIGDYVWLDQNSDGSPAGENGLPGVTINLYLDLGTVGVYEVGTDTAVGTTTTDAGGGYLFDDLIDTNYVVIVDTTTLPGGAGGAGANTHDRDGNQDSVTFVTIVPTAHDGTDNALDADFGYGPSSSLDLVKTTTNGATFTIGATVNYQVVLAVPSGALITGAQFTDTLPVNLDAVAATNQVLSVTLNGVASTGVTYGAHTLGDDTNPQVLVVNLGDLQTTNGGTDPDGTVVIAYSAVVQNTSGNSAGQTKTNTAAVTGNDGAAINKSDTVSIAIVEPDLAITKTVENVTPCTPSRTREGKLASHAPEPDDIVEYTIVITNSATDSSTAYNVTVVDTLDAGLEYVTNALDVDYSLPTGDLTTAPDVAGQVLTWGNAQTTPLDIDIPAGGSITFSYRVRVLPGVTAGQSLDNSATATWYSLDGGSGRDGTGGTNDYSIASSPPAVTAWSDPATLATTVTVSGTGATIADDGTIGGTNIVDGPLTGLDRLLLQNGAEVTITGDGVPNHTDGNPDPFGTPSANAEASASAVIISDGTSSFAIDELILNTGSTLELRGDSIYEIGSLTMASGSTLVIPVGSTILVRGFADFNGAADEANHARIVSKTTGGGYALFFNCTVDASYIHFAEVGDGYVQFEGPTDISHGVFTEGSGAEPYIKYTYSEDKTWDHLAFDASGGKTQTIENSGTGTVTVDVYMGPTLNWIGGDTTDNEAPGPVVWANATPCRGFVGTLAAPETGGVRVSWQTEVEEGVASFAVERADGRRWTRLGSVFSTAEPFRGSAYEYVDRSAAPRTRFAYRIVVQNCDGSTRTYDLGEETAIAAAPVLASIHAGRTTRADNSPVAEVTELTFTAPTYATDTPVQTGTASKATVSGTGLYAVPGKGTIYNVGRPLPRLGGNFVFVRGLDDTYTESNVVWAGELAITGEPGAIPAPAVTGELGPDGFVGVFRAEENESFTVNAYLPPGPNWYFSRDYELKGGTIRPLTMDIAQPRDGEATITIGVRATSTGNHDLGIEIGGQVVGWATWSGAGHYRVRARFEAGLLVDGANTLHLHTESSGSTKRLDYVEVRTPATPALRDGYLLVRALDGGAGVVTVPGAKWAVDATDFGGERLLTVSGSGSVSGLRTGALVYLCDSAQPLAWGAEQTLANPVPSDATYLAVAPAAMLDELAPLIARRMDEGHRAVALSLADVQDVFGGGLFGPAALVRLARATEVRNLLLAAGTTYDYHNYEGLGTPVGIPCGFVHVREGLAASDDLYTNGFTTAVGRLPAHSAAELANMVRKILDFSPGNHVALLSDADDTGSTLDRFAQLQAELADILPSVLIPATGRAGSAVRADLIEALRGGTRIVAYQGHGGSEYIGYDGNRIFGVEHCSQVPPSAWILSTCLTGSYWVNDTSLPILSHELLKTPTNGAVAVLCSTRYGESDVEHEIVRQALLRIAAGNATWGDVLLHVKKQLAGNETTDVYTLLGDPAMRTATAEDTREVAIVHPNAGDVLGQGAVTIRLRLLGEGWTTERLEVLYRRGAGAWTAIDVVQTSLAATVYELQWKPPEDGADYQLMVREVTE